MPNYNNNNNTECEGFKVGDVVAPAPNGSRGYNLNMIEGNEYVVTDVSCAYIYVSGVFRSRVSNEDLSDIAIAFDPSDVVHTSSTTREAVDKPTKGVYIKTHTLTKLRSILNLTVDYPMTVMNYNKYFIACPTTLNTSKEKPLTNGDEGNFWLYGSKDTKIKLSKILKAIFGINDSTLLEHYNNKWKQTYSVDTSSVEVTEDIRAIYDATHASSGELGSSCMRYKGEWMDIYQDVGTKVAYIKDADGVLLARALFWDNNIVDEDGNVSMVLDRIFSSSQNHTLTLKKWAKENDITLISDIDYKKYTTIKEHNYNYDGVPYIDNFCYSYNGKLTTSDEHGAYDTLQATDGTTGEKGYTNISTIEVNYCDCCEESTNGDLHCTYEDSYVCEGCLDEYYHYCEDVDSYVYHDHCYYIASCDYYVKDLDDYFECACDGELYPIDDAIEDRDTGDLYYVDNEHGLIQDEETEEWYRDED